MSAEKEPDPDPETGNDEEGLSRMSFGDHLDELRHRLLKALGAMLVAVVIMLPFHDQVMDLIVEPYRILWARHFTEWVEQLEEQERAGTLDEYETPWLAFCRAERDSILAGTFDHPQKVTEWSGFWMNYSLVAIGGLEDFWTFMMGALIFALAMASPIVIYQLWAFIAAGLYARERKAFYRYFPFSIGLLVLGVLFGYFLAVPYGLGFLVRLMNIGTVQPLLSVSQYFTILFTLTTALGIVFQLPLVMLAVNRVGLVTHKTFRKQWRFVILGIFVVSAMFTPPDPFTLFLMALPTVILFFVGLFLTAQSERTRGVGEDGAATEEPSA